MKALLQGFNDSFFRSVFEEIHRSGVGITALVTSKPDLYRGDARFEAIRLVDDVELIKNAAHPEADAESFRGPLDRPILERHVATELSVLSLSDRNSYFPKSAKFRKRVYYRLLRYWINEIERAPPDAIVFANTPHSVESIVLYAVARERSITTLIVERTNVDDRVLIKSGIDERIPVPRDFATELTDAEIERKLTDLYGPDLFGKSRWERRSIAANSAALRTGASTRSPRKLGNYGNRVAGWVAAPFRNRDNAPAVFFDRIRNEFLLRLLRAFNSIGQRRLATRYASLAVAADTGKNYVYFPLHFQPERTTSPLGGVFEDQILAVRMISAALPSGWRLYVKEHPRQMDRGSYYSLQQRHYRNSQDYLAIAELENVSLIRLEESSDDLVRNAKAIVTITGTSGWQALTLGIPALCFGYASYLDCPSAYFVGSVAECRDAIAAATRKTARGVTRDLKRYLLHLAPRMIKAVHSHSALPEGRNDGPEMARNLSGKIVEMLSATGVSA